MGLLPWILLVPDSQKHLVLPKSMVASNPSARRHFTLPSLPQESSTTPPDPEVLRVSAAENAP
jgi:hypothetical protein